MVTKHEARKTSFSRWLMFFGVLVIAFGTCFFLTMIANIESNQLKRQYVRIGFANDSLIGRASDLINWLVSGSSPDHLLYYWIVAQLVERATVNRKVTGSNPVYPAI